MKKVDFTWYTTMGLMYLKHKLFELRIWNRPLSKRVQRTFFNGTNEARHRSMQIKNAFKTRVSSTCLLYITEYLFETRFWSMRFQHAFIWCKWNKLFKRLFEAKTVLWKYLTPKGSSHTTYKKHQINFCMQEIKSLRGWVKNKKQTKVSKY